MLFQHPRAHQTYSSVFSVVCTAQLSKLNAVQRTALLVFIRLWISVQQMRSCCFLLFSGFLGSDLGFPGGMSSCSFNIIELCKRYSSVCSIVCTAQLSRLKAV
jgi:hypothetical protein